MRTEKVKVAKQFLCSECSKTFDSSAKLKGHMLSGLHATAKKKKCRNRTTVMSQLKKLSDPEYLKEINRLVFSLLCPSTCFEFLPQGLPETSDPSALNFLRVFGQVSP